MLRRPFFWIIALVVAAFIVSPLIGNDVQLRESLALAAVYITLASNLNLMLGYAGYINFGSIVFFGRAAISASGSSIRIIGHWLQVCSQRASA